MEEESDAVQESSNKHKVDEEEIKHESSNATNETLSDKEDVSKLVNKEPLEASTGVTDDNEEARKHESTMHHEETLSEQKDASRTVDDETTIVEDANSGATTTQIAKHCCYPG